LAIVVLSSAGSFWAGILWRSRGVITYYVYEDQMRRPVSFNLDWPTYGLPLTDYSLLLSTLQAGDRTNAMAKAEALLDLAVYDAIQRRTHLSGQDRERLDRAIVRAADYRREHPRPVTGNANTDVVTKMQSKIDGFLRQFEGNK